MDAFVQNKCEAEILAIMKEVSEWLHVPVRIDTMPLEDGGLRRYLQVIAKSERKTPVIATGVIVGITVGILAAFPTKLSEKLIDKIFEDTEMKMLEKEKLKLEIEQLKQNISKSKVEHDRNQVVAKRRSNFYEILQCESKIEKVSFAGTETVVYTAEQYVPREAFTDFVIADDILQPQKDDNAIIEIISPVLKGGNYKWHGLYNGGPITFRMQAMDFKASVRRGEIEFKNGASISCVLIINRKLTADGREKFTGYDVIQVNSFFDNTIPGEVRINRVRDRAHIRAPHLPLFDELDEQRDKSK